MRKSIVIWSIIVLLTSPLVSFGDTFRLKDKDDLGSTSGAYIFTDGPEGVKRWAIPPSLSLNRGDVVGCYGPDDDNKAYVKSGVLNPISGNLNAAVDVIVTTGAGGQTITVSNNSAIYVNDTSGAVTYQLPATATGKQFLFRNAATRTGAITIKVTTSQYIDKDGVLGTVTTGTLVSGGALGDRAAVYGQDATHWLAETPKGTWTNN